MNLETIREHYQNLDDALLEKIALEESAGLRSEVVEILKNEIRQRNLNPQLIKGIEAQRREPSQEELQVFCHLIRNLPCISCNQQERKLNATIVGEVYSIILFTSYEKNVKLACPICLDKMHNNAYLKSLVLGWWGIPWGPIHTIRSFFFNYTMKKGNQKEAPSEVLIQLIRDNIGKLSALRNDPYEIGLFIRNL